MGIDKVEKMSGDTADLLAFLRKVDWETYIDDDEVRSHVVEIQERIESLGGENSGADDEDVDLSGATRIKLVVVGDGAVGKTSLLISYATKKFPTDYVPTVFENYTAQMKRGKQNILLHLWDTAGQEDYDRLRPLSYPGADVVLLCFSLVTKASYHAIKEKWSPEVKHYVPNVPHIPVGTKVDLRDSEMADPHTTKFEPISKEEGEQMAQQIKAAAYVEVSSKTRKGLDFVFETADNCALEARGDRSDAEGASADEEERAKPVAPRKQKKCVM